ncbi:MAG: hypothetical protein Kilf2KO_02100 [Rhodospirillales bacterium]
MRRTRFYWDETSKGTVVDTRTLCLAALLDNESSGYEIKKRLDAPPFCHFQDTGFGSIYPALTRLAGEGLIVGWEHPQDGRPDKKVYRLTESGRSRLLEALSQPPGPDRFRSDFLFSLFMSDLLPRRHVQELVDRRIAELNATLAEMAACEDKVTQRANRFVFDMGRSFYTNERDFLLENRHRLNAEMDESAPATVARSPETVTVESPS